MINIKQQQQIGLLLIGGLFIEFILSTDQHQLVFFFY